MPAPGTPRSSLCSKTIRPPRCSPRACQSCSAELGEAERVSQQRLAGSRVGDERVDGLEALQRELGRDARRARGERLVVGLIDRELVAHALGVGEPQPARLAHDLDALAGEALAPEVERRLA